MKKTTTLIMTLLISVSLIGQTAINKNPVPATGSLSGHKGIDLKSSEHKKLTKEPAYFQQKSSFAIKHRMDSTVWELYNAPLNQWDPDQKEELSYYANGKVSLYTNYFWTAKSGWEPGEKEDFTYDAGGNLSLYNYYIWNDPYNTWDITYKTEYAYDANDNLTLEVLSAKDGGNWYILWKNVYSYNANDHISGDTAYFWNVLSSTLMPYSFTDYSYDVNNKLITTVSHLYDQGSGWTADTKAEYTYDANGYLSQIVAFNWDDQSSQWKESEKNEYTVNGIGNTTEDIFYLYNDINSQWINSNRSVYGYDFSANPTNEEYFDWDDVGSQWTGTDKYNYSYNISYALTDLIIPPLYFFQPDYSEKIKNMPLSVLTYDNDGSWKMDFRLTYHYSDHDVGISEKLADDAASIFPNPASGFVTIELDNRIDRALFTLTDIRGKVMLQRDVSGNDKIGLSHLPAGLYFYNISVKNKVLRTGKLAVE